MKVMLSLKTTAAGGREKFVKNGYRPDINIKGQLVGVVFDDLKTDLEPGKSAMASMIFSTSKGNSMNIEKGLIFDIHEGKKIIGCGIISELAEEKKEE